MMNRKMILWILSAAVSLWIFGGRAALAVDTEENEPDYSQIEDVMEDMLPETVDLSFSRLVDQLVSGDFQGIFEGMKEYALSQIVYEVRVTV